jgi:hypothetical protein
MKDFINKITALALIMAQMTIALPAQEVFDKERGKTRLEQYLDRAGQERDAEKWERLAEAGFEAAMREWESANLYLREQGDEAWAAETAAAEGYYLLEKEKAYVKWASERYYKEREEIERSALAAEIRAAAEEWSYDNGAGGTRKVGLEEAGVALEQWEAAAWDIVEGYINRWEERNGTLRSEIAGRFREAGISEEEKQAIYEGMTIKSREAMVREYGRTAEAEGNRLFMELLYDQGSVRQISSAEAAEVLAREMAAEAEEATARTTKALFDRFEELNESAGAEDIEIGAKEWLEDFRRAFEAGLAKWENAEKSFLAARAEWERDAEAVYIESEGEWVKAYGELVERQAAWEKELISKLDAGYKAWQESRQGLAMEIDAARKELAAASAEAKNTREKMVGVQVDIYNRSRELLTMTKEGIEAWYELWGEEYREVYAWYESGPPDSVTGETIEIVGIDSSWLEELKEVKMGELTGANAEAKYEEIKRQLELWQEIYLKKIQETYYQHEGLAESQINQINRNMSAAEITFIIKSVGYTLGENEEKYDENLYKSAEALINRGSGWLAMGKKYREMGDDAAEEIYSLTGVNIGSMEIDGYKNELETELLKARAVLEYWAEELAVARELEEYARNNTSTEEEAGRTLEALEGSKKAYEAAVREYEAAAAHIKEEGERIDAAAEALEEAKEELNKRRVKVEEARKNYGDVVATIRGFNEYTVKNKAGVLMVRIAGIWGIEVNTEEAEDKEDAGEKSLKEIMGEQLREYYAAANKYAEASQNLQVFKVINEQRDGNGRGMASINELEKLKNRAAEMRKSADGEGKIGSFTGAEEIKSKLKILYGEQASAKETEKELIGAAITELWEELENWYDDEIKKRNDTITYLTGGSFEAVPLEEERRKKELQSYLIGQKAGLEAEKGSVGAQAAAGYEDLIGKIEGILGKIEEGSGWETVRVEVNGLRDGDEIFDAVIRGKTVLGTAGEAIAWAAYQQARRENGLTAADAMEAIERDYGKMEARSINAANETAHEAVRVLIAEKAGDIGKGVSYEEAARIIKELREAGKDLSATGKEALENYIEGLIELAAVNDVYNGSASMSDEDIKGLKDAYKKAEEKWKGYGQWQYQLYEVNDFYKIFTSALYGGTGKEEKEVLWAYAADCAAGFINGGELTEHTVDGVISAIRAYDESLDKADGTNWSGIFLGLGEVEKNGIAKAILNLYRSNEGDYGIYVEWLKAIYDGEGDVKLVEGTYGDLNENIKKFYEEYDKTMAGETGEEETADGETEATETENREPSVWEYFVKGGAEILYAYLTSPYGYEYARDAGAKLKELDVGLWSRLSSYIRIEEAVNSYVKLLDADFEEWFERYEKEYKEKNPDESFSVEERERIKERLLYNIERRDSPYYIEENAKLMLEERNTRLLPVKNKDMESAARMIANIIERSAAEFEAAVDKYRYGMYVQEENKNSRIEWAKKITYHNITDEKTKLAKGDRDILAAAAKKVNAKTLYGHLAGNLAEIGGYFNEAALEFSPLGGGGAAPSTEERRKIAEEAYAKYMATKNEDTWILNEIREYTRQLDKNKELTANIGKKEREALEALKEAQKEYEEYAGGGYAAAVNAVESAYDAYNAAIEAADAKYDELKEARLEKRKRQEIYDWAGSIYLSEFGNSNSVTYKTPKEKLGETEYSYERAFASVEVLEELISGKTAWMDAGYSEAFAGYKEEGRKYYEGLVTVYEAQLAIQKQEEIVREAELEENMARMSLTHEANGKVAAKDSDLVIVTKNADGSYKIELGYKVYAGGTSLKNGEAYEEYFNEKEVEIETVDGLAKITAAEAEAREWLNERILKMPNSAEYIDKLMLAGLYIMINGDKKELSDWGVSGKDEYDLGGISLDGDFHTIDIGELYKRYMSEVMIEAYSEVMKSEVSRVDLGRYLLYRGKNLIDNAKEYEKTLLEIKAVTKLKDFLEDMWDVKNTEGTVEATAAGVAGAGAIAAGLLQNWGLAGWLAGEAVIAGIAAGVSFDQRNSLGEVISDLEDMIDGRSENDSKRKSGLADAYKDWKAKKENMDAEWRILNGMYYGQETKPEKIEVNGEMVLPGIKYEAFIRGVKLMISGNNQGIGREEALRLFNEKTYNDINAGRDGMVSGALTAYNKYLESMKHESGAGVEREKVRLLEAQSAASAEYSGVVNGSLEIPVEMKEKLRGLALRASDKGYSVEERQAASEEYDEIMRGITASPAELKAELKRLAETAWGDGTWNGERHNANLIEAEKGYMDSRVVYGRDTETYTEYAEGNLFDAMLGALDAAAEAETEVKETEWALLMLDLEKQAAEWEGQMSEIVNIARIPSPVALVGCRTAFS